MEVMMEVEVEVGPTEETIEALLDYFVEPFLPVSKTKAAEPPSISQHQLIAKQVHAVVLLYNYYHRKYNPALEILTFESFCKLAVLLKPNLMAYMSLMRRTNYYEINHLENQLSLTEKAIMDGCDVSLALDASKRAPPSEGWPICKVAILLIDYRKENCLVLHGPVTSGVWSVIEKDVIFGSKISTTKVSTADKNACEVELQNLALLTIEKVAGITQADLVVLESHDVYCLSKKRAAVRFYIMQCAQSSHEDFRVPLKDVVERLQGPLVKKGASGWMVTPAVEYFHMLPYVEIIQDWLSRNMPPNGLQDLKVESENMKMSDSSLIENFVNVQVFDETSFSSESCISAYSVSGKTSTQINESSVTKETTESEDICLPDKVDDPSGMDVENGQCLQNVISVQDQQNNMCMSEAHERVAVNDVMDEAEMVDSISMLCSTEIGDVENESNDQLSITVGAEGAITSESNELVPLSSKSQHLERLEDTRVSEEDALLQTALNVLLTKREKLSHQLRDLADEIALCDKAIQTIVQGGENGSDIKKDITLQVCQDGEKDVQPGSERKRLHDTIQKPCQELDDICHANNWKLPTYDVFISDGGFQSSVTVEALDFELTVKGNMHSGSRDARESAATHMITKLQGLIG